MTDMANRASSDAAASASSHSGAPVIIVAYTCGTRSGTFGELLTNLKAADSKLFYRQPMVDERYNQIVMPILEEVTHLQTTIEGKEGSTSKYKDIIKMLADAAKDHEHRKKKESLGFLHHMLTFNNVTKGNYVVGEEDGIRFPQHVNKSTCALSRLLPIEHLHSFAADWVASREGKGLTAEWKDFVTYCTSKTTFSAKILELFKEGYKAPPVAEKQKRANSSHVSSMDQGFDDQRRPHIQVNNSSYYEKDAHRLARLEDQIVSLEDQVVSLEDQVVSLQDQVDGLKDENKELRSYMRDNGLHVPDEYNPGIQPCLENKNDRSENQDEMLDENNPGEWQSLEHPNDRSESKNNTAAPKYSNVALPPARSPRAWAYLPAVPGSGITQQSKISVMSHMTGGSDFDSDAKAPAQKKRKFLPGVTPVLESPDNASFTKQHTATETAASIERGILTPISKRRPKSHSDSPYSLEGNIWDS